MVLRSRETIFVLCAVLLALFSIIQLTFLQPPCNSDEQDGSRSTLVVHSSPSVPAGNSGIRGVEGDATQNTSSNTTTTTHSPQTYAYAFLYYAPENGHERTTTAGCELLVAIQALRMARQRDREHRRGVVEHVDIVVMELPGPQNALPPAIQTLLATTSDAFSTTIIHPIKAPVTQGTGTQSWTRRYQQSFAKLRAAELFHYRRVIFLELDYLSLRSLDHWFLTDGDRTTSNSSSSSSTEDRAVLRVPYAAPKFYWSAQKSYSQAGPFYVDPYPKFWQEYFQATLDGDGGGQGRRYDGDNDWTNAQFSGQEPLLHGFYALLVGEFIQGDGIYNYWGQYYGLAAAEIYRMAYGIHFVAGHKPWALQPARDIDNHPEDPAYAQLRAVYETWWTVRDQICPTK